MAGMSCIPIRLFPEKYLCFGRCQVLPGVRLAPLEGPVKTLIEDMNARSDALRVVSADFHPTHAICIAEGEYLV